MGNMLMILAVVAGIVFAVRWLMRRRRPIGGMQSAMQYAGPVGGRNHAHSPRTFPPTSFGGMGAGASGPAAAAAHIPGDFDVEGFLRQAKPNFIRLQAANDCGAMEDIRQFCSPELAAEVQMQYQERNRQAQQTDVMHLKAELLAVSVEAGRMLESMRFSGQIREEAGAPAEVFNEVWHLASGLGAGPTWRIAGIQQD